MDLHLKAMLDHLEQDADNVVISMAELTRSDEALMNRVRQSLGLRSLNGANILGVVVQQLNSEKCKAQAAVEFTREPDAKAFEDEAKALLPPAATFLGLFLNGLRIEVQGGAAAGPGPTGPAMRPGLPGQLNPPDGGDPNAPPGSSGGPKSTMKIERKGKVVVLDADLNLTERAYERIYGMTQGLVMRMKGMVDMSGGDPRYFDLAAAGVKYRKDAVEKEKKAANVYPRATFPREDTQGRLSRSWPPNQRVSWMAGLLPFLGYQEIYDRVELRGSPGGRRTISNRGRC